MDDGLRAFAATADMPNLKHFGLTETRRLGTYTAAGILAVVTSPRFPKLCDLELESHQTSTLDYKRLFASAGLNRLTRLRLGWASDVAAAVRCPHLGKLEELSVNSSTITDADADALLANPALANLTRARMLGMNAGKARLSPSADQRLRERFGAGLRLEYT